MSQNSQMQHLRTIQSKMLLKSPLAKGRKETPWAMTQQNSLENEEPFCAS